MNIRSLAVASAIIATVGLNACSSETKNSIIAESTTTSSSLVVVETTVAPVESTVPPTAAPATAPPATVPPTAPPATAPPATAAPGYSLYDEVSRPNVPGTRTDPFTSSGVLGNGVYWVQYLGGETMTPSIELREAYFGAECETQAALVGEECNNDIFIKEDPRREIDDLPFADDVFLTVADVGTQRSYWITPDELRTVRASSPSVDDAPDGVYASFPYLMTVQGGQIVKFEQLWVP
jgi:hypothetical protein